MPSEEAKIKVFTVEEANALLPRVQLILKSLREHRNSVLKTQAKIEIEEMTGSDPEGRLSPAAQAAMTRLMGALHFQTRQFEETLEDLFQLGAHLKDLDSGLVDFYCLRGEEIVFLCWKEGETEILHWHGLQGGFQSRQPLD